MVNVVIQETAEVAIHADLVDQTVVAGTIEETAVVAEADQTREAATVAIEAATVAIKATAVVAEAETAAVEVETATEAEIAEDRKDGDQAVVLATAGVAKTETRFSFGLSSA